MIVSANYILPLMVGIALAWSNICPALPSPSLIGNPEQSTAAGHFTLRWELSEPLTSEILLVEQSDDPDFAGKTKIFPTGDASSLFFSGLKDGIYYYRVKVEDYHTNDHLYSDTLKVTVNHFDSEYALLLLLLGGISFAGIVVVIARGER